MSSESLVDIQTMRMMET